jgi:hypothetical protein
MATYVLTVNGVAKQLLPGWVITESANGRNRMDFAMQSLNGSFRAVNDDAVTLTEDGTTIFGGLIDRPSEAGFGGATSTSAIVQRLSAVDYNVYASRDSLIQDIPSGSLKAALTVVAAALAAFGVTLDAAQVTGPTLPALSYNERPIVDVLNEICSLASGTGSTSYVWEIDYAKTLRAKASNSEAAPFNVADGDGHVLGDITVEEPRSADYGNYIRLYGGSGLKDETDTFTGDGVTTNFTLNYTLNSSAGYVTVNGVAETLGSGGTWTYDAPSNSITRTSAPAVAAVIVINYVAAFPRIVISDGGLPAANRVVKVYTAPDVFDTAVLQPLADSYLTRDMASPKTVRYGSAYSLTGIHPGQYQDITVAKRNLSGNALITEVRIVNVSGTLVQRQVSAASSLRLPATLRERFQQAFGGGSATSAAAVSILTGGTFLSSPATLGGSDVAWRLCNTPTRVQSAQPYDAPAALGVTVQGLVSSESSQSVTIHLWDANTNTSAGSVTKSSVGRTPVEFDFPLSLVLGHRYWLYVEAVTSGIAATACGQLVSA